MGRNIVIGIDLGTTNTVVAFVKENGEPVILTKKIDGQDKQLLPSVVYFKDGYPIVGQRAKNSMSYKSSAFGITQVKLEQMKPLDQVRTLTIGGVTYYPEDIQKLILKQAMIDANIELRKMGVIGNSDTVRDVIITIPAFFQEDARRQTENAALKAELNLLGLIHEPAAAALCYFSRNEKDSAQTMLVLDLGGGTFDICLLSKKGRDIDVLDQNGGPEQGGYFWDRRLLSYALDKAFELAGIDDDNYMDDDEMDEYLRTDDGYTSIISAERCRESLTLNESAQMVVKWNGVVYTVTITRKEFNQCCQPLLNLLIQNINDVCQSTGHLADKDNHKRFVGVDKILLVGGATRMPIIEQTLYDYYEASRDIVITRKDFKYRFSPDTSVAIGAAIYGNNIGYYNMCWQKAINTTDSGKEDEEPGLRFQPVSDVPDLVIKIPTNYTYGILAMAHIDGKDIQYICNVIMKGEKLSSVKKIDDRFTTVRDKLIIKVYESQSSKDHEKYNENIHTLCGKIAFTMDSKLPKDTPVYFSVGMDPKGRVSIIAECNGKREQLTIN